MWRKISLFCVLMGSCMLGLAQDSSYIAKHLELDSVVVSASRVNFDIPGFIRMVEEDTTFYKAFKTLRILAYTAENHIEILGKKQDVIASLTSTTRQHRRYGCRTMSTLQEQTTGDFFSSDSDYNYYTAELYANLFFTTGEICDETNIVKGGHDTPVGNSSMQKHTDQLKELIFNPGQPIPGVPLISRKVAIFDDKVAPMYDFSITSAPYHGKPCYVFTAQAKPAYVKNVVINKLVTYFDKDNLEIVYRDYALSYDAWVFDFNVHIRVQMTHFAGYLVPSVLNYQGNWKVPFRKRERARFTARFHDFALSGQ